MRRIVVVGGGLAGHRAAQTLRKNGFKGELTIVGDEPHRPYDRPPLSKQLLAGAVEAKGLEYPCDGVDVRWILGQPATGLDLAARRVHLGNGDSLEYEGLVIATGRRARAWPGGVDLEGIYTLRSLEHCLALRRAVAPGCRVAIVGAGFIGCEVAATLRMAGVEKVTVIDIAGHPMPPMGAAVGERAARLHARHGVRLFLGTSVAEFEGENSVAAVRLDGGERIEADAVLLALGSVPNSEWLEGSGLELDRGAVVCDAELFAVGAENVVVCGDIAAFPHPHIEGPVCIEHWTNAREMAVAAAANLLADPGTRRPYLSVPSFWSDQYDVKIRSVGFVNLADRYQVVNEDVERPALLVEAYRDDELIGAVTFNKNRTIIEYQNRLAATLAAV